MKLLHYTTILLFALVSVFMGCGEDRQDEIPVIKGEHVFVLSKPNWHDSAALSKRRLDSAILIHMKIVECKNKRDEYEIKYLRTENERYRILGNKYVDSGNYYFSLYPKVN